jgi:hypothetical protein
MLPLTRYELLVGLPLLTYAGIIGVQITGGE